MLFLKVNKRLFTLVKCNTSLSKNYVAHSITVVCVIGWTWGKKTDLSALSVSRCKRSKFDNVVEFEFQLRHMLTSLPISNNNSPQETSIACKKFQQQTKTRVKEDTEQRTNDYLSSSLATLWFPATTRWIISRSVRQFSTTKFAQGHKPGCLKAKGVQEEVK